MTRWRVGGHVESFSVEPSFDHADARAAIVFVDMSGYTALTEVHGDHVAAQFAVDFADMATAALGTDDELIKTMGDAVMVASADAPAALAFLRRLGAAAGRADGFPMLRAGVSAGVVVKRGGDVYGTTVNAAARLAALALPGQVVVCRDVAAFAREVDLPIEALGLVSIRNMAEPMELFAVDTAGGHQQHVDPVCRMHVNATSAAATLSRDGRTYRFCSRACADRFDPRAKDATESSNTQ
ncbi:YHS domain-containing protein [Mycolicibacterium lacusdiani]|uniref:YHS domain-containing protein n=1 Tax=Mycolicibacterium lacusdiani TaxID=2895283 RepID=UPI001F1C8758|nr:adenylate/guanylate cyclase domain-containing protein [Mycolicibacterium lacusdiani]